MLIFIKLICQKQCQLICQTSAKSIALGSMDNITFKLELLTNGDFMVEKLLI